MIELTETLPNTWKEALQAELEKDYFKELLENLDKEYTNETIYPNRENVFHLLNLIQLDEIKVVILGQDPYHGPNQAHGLAFSVQKGYKIAPSLKNIFKELERSLNYKYSSNGDLSNWANQGVFLLNSLLTVREGKPLSHKYLKWEVFTDKLIETVNNECNNIVFLLWGAKAQSKKKLIDQKKHFVLESVHPSPLSAYRGFLGNNHFVETNQILLKINK